MLVRQPCILPPPKILCIEWATRSLKNCLFRRWHVRKFIKCPSIKGSKYRIDLETACVEIWHIWHILYVLPLLSPPICCYVLKCQTIVGDHALSLIRLVDLPPFSPLNPHVLAFRLEWRCWRLLVLPFFHNTPATAERRVCGSKVFESSQDIDFSTIYPHINYRRGSCENCKDFCLKSWCPLYRR